MAKMSAKDETPSVDHQSRTARTAELVKQLHAVVEELEAMHLGRRFPLDGHLVGSIGEAAAETMLDIVPVPASTAGHRRGRRRWSARRDQSDVRLEWSGCTTDIPRFRRGAHCAEAVEDPNHAARGGLQRANCDGASSRREPVVVLH